RTPRRRVERRRYALRGEPPRDLAAPCALEVAVMRAEPLRRGVLEVLEPGSPRLLRQQGRGRPPRDVAGLGEIGRVERGHPDPAVLSAERVIPIEEFRQACP